MRHEIDQIPPEFYKSTGHFENRMTHREIPHGEINHTIKFGRIIEANNSKINDVHVLLRHDFATHSTCVVVALIAHTVRTAYTNRLDDTHTNGDMQHYNWHVNVKQFTQYLKAHRRK